ncbi:unnamed protein product [Cuscuta campestris]|uniref:Uncharacterized protein n=1 Tax=Cuscuta campestris TaxID=132261 RepID=A0A484MZC8_9ASTE|nr:unnamed protein product [Cuscuta campestris]
MTGAPSSPDLSMPSFHLLSDSDEERFRPKKKISDASFSPDEDVSIHSFHGDEVVLPSSSSDTDPSWNYRKKYLGGDFLPDGVEWSSDLECEEADSDDESITTEEIREMNSDSEIIFAEPVESPSKLQRFRQRVLKAKGTLRSGGRGQ